jgi:hypothetical protein
MKGDANLLLSIMVFLAVLIFLTGFVVLSFPTFIVITPFDFTIFGGSVIAVSGACVVATGIPCAVALVGFGVLTFFTFSNPLLWVIFIPLSVVLVYIIAKLGRGN